MTLHPIHLRAPLFSSSSINTTTTTTTTTATTTTTTTGADKKTKGNTSTSTSPSIPPTSNQDTKLPTLPTIPQLLGKWHVTHSTLPMWKDKRNVSITYDLLPPASTTATPGSSPSFSPPPPPSSSAPPAPPALSQNSTRTVQLTRLDDTVRYQKKSSSSSNSSSSRGGGGGGSFSVVRGIDTAVPRPSGPETILTIPSLISSSATTTTTTAPVVTTTKTTAPVVASTLEHMRWRWKGTGWVTRWFSSEWEVLGFGIDDDDDDDDADGDGDGDGDGRNYWLVTYFSKTMVTPAGIDILSRRAGGPTEKTVRRIREALREVSDEDVRRLEGMIFGVKSENLD